MRFRIRRSRIGGRTDGLLTAQCGPFGLRPLQTFECLAVTLCVRQRGGRLRSANSYSLPSATPLPAGPVLRHRCTKHTLLRERGFVFDGRPHCTVGACQAGVGVARGVNKNFPERSGPPPRRLGPSERMRLQVSRHADDRSAPIGVIANLPRRGTSLVVNQTEVSVAARRCGIGVDCATVAGSVNSKQAPRPASAVASTRPPWRSTMRCTMLRPMPLPA